MNKLSRWFNQLSQRVSYVQMERNGQTENFGQKWIFV